MIKMLTRRGISFLSVRLGKSTKLVQSYFPAALCHNEPTISDASIHDLERLALVDLDSPSGIKCLNDAIRFADQLLSVDTTSVTPMINTIYDRNENLRDDKVTEGNVREQLMKLAVETEEFYYVAPPGNVPVNLKKKMKN